MYNYQHIIYKNINLISEMIGTAFEEEVFLCLVRWSRLKVEECH